MRAKSIIVLVALALSIFSSSWANTENTTYISKKEFENEISLRKEDIARTKERLVSLQAEEERTTVEIEEAKLHIQAVDRIVAKRAKVYSRLYRRGTAVKYLLGSKSPIQLLKRFNQMRRLIKDGVLARQQASLRLEQAEAELSRINDENNKAEQLISMLEQAVGELEAEK